MDDSIPNRGLKRNRRWIERHRWWETEREREGEGYRERERDRETDRQAGIQTYG